MLKTLGPLFVGCCRIVLVVLLVACQGTTWPEIPTTDTLASRINHYMREHYPQFSGTILVAQKDQGLMSQGYGLADREQDVPNTPQTRFAIGSITKSFTAMAIMILQERGSLKIEDPICNYLADCPDAWKPVTMYHLLTHTSGIPSYTDLYIQGKIAADPCKAGKPETIIAYFKDLALEFTPGSRWHYSNSGYFLLGAVIEKVSGDSYEAFIEKNILQPLGMTETGYDRAGTIIPRRASGYSIDQLRDPFTNAPCLDASLDDAAGGLVSTVGDLYRWDQALYTDRLVSQETLGTIFTSTVSLVSSIAGEAVYGYGWEISQQSGHRVIWHNGLVWGFASYLARYPDDQLTIIVLSNVDSTNAAQVGRELAAIVLGRQ
jgi:CubicO group peptidase (beta-lactamase class C family)